MVVLAHIVAPPFSRWRTVRKRVFRAQRIVVAAGMSARVLQTVELYARAFCDLREKKIVVLVNVLCGRETTRNDTAVAFHNDSS